VGGRAWSWRRDACGEKPAGGMIQESRCERGSRVRSAPEWRVGCGAGDGWVGWPEVISVPGLIYRWRSGFWQIGSGSLRLQGREDDRWSKGFKRLEVPWSAVYTTYTKDG
jgi:hypothetical protein